MEQKPRRQLEHVAGLQVDARAMQCSVTAWHVPVHLDPSHTSVPSTSQLFKTVLHFSMQVFSQWEGGFELQCMRDWCLHNFWAESVKEVALIRSVALPQVKSTHLCLTHRMVGFISDGDVILIKVSLHNWSVRAFPSHVNKSNDLGFWIWENILATRKNKKATLDCSKLPGH